MTTFSSAGLAAKSQVESLPEEDARELAGVLAAKYGYTLTNESNKMKILTRIVPVLAAVVLVALVGALVLSGLGQDASAAYTIASLVAGGLVGIFAPTPQT
ncbi:hypothetical protein C5C27_05930 [Rathayibacter sp. AY2B7]|uniref:hypothetical protein n=1 Tax=unclassified Rathayibacter TaxID=2609250 RepID=UPI000CE8972C|nr:MULTISPECIES: hypothetical protein [unclassified Rathayibacter]PPG07897.1 hypothetical protein C5C26_08760 [Rathayibacter sp. AY2B1]PPG63371.1 hypothetical protein C5C27_05930 [Rathayibacter sp. AY2B7]PPG72766.1 hypothetical protein C5C59_06345 [Rathayibacter sp. AY1F4]